MKLISDLGVDRPEFCDNRCVLGDFLYSLYARIIRSNVKNTTLIMS